MSQSQLATCPPVFDWAKNLGNLDPCAVGSSLIGLCNTSGQFQGLVPLSSGAVYPLPTSDNENKCTCSSVVYALVSVCSACQNAAYTSWSDWTSFCGSVYTPKFPVHTDISIPQWAIFDVQAEPTFNITRAQNSVTPTPPSVTDIPSPTEANSTSMTSTPTTETTSSEGPSSRIPTSIDPVVSEVLPSSSNIATLSQTTSSADIVPITQASGADPTSITSTDQSQSHPVSATSTKKGSNTGTVAGGTVAGIIILLIIGALVFWWIRRQRRSRMAPSAAYIAAYGTARPPTNMSQRPYQGRAISPFVTDANSNVPYYDEDFRASAYSDIRQP
ncbi:hypothetical protein BJ912DRAFT_518582 [Pholiota molesta]|nr:hypothetical protein BJ912DRAFT_518582 [Pholiota molesta]